MRSLKPPPSVMEELAIKKMPVKEADIVRYRVYSDEENYVAVIAENALMAMKIADIDSPHKVVRDIIVRSSLAQEALDKEKQEPWHFNMHEVIRAKPKPSLRETTEEDEKPAFVPMHFGELKKEKPGAQVLGPDALLKMMEEAQANIEKAAQQTVETPEAAQEKDIAEEPAAPPSEEMPQEAEAKEEQPAQEPQKEEQPKEAASEADGSQQEPGPLSAKDVVGLISEPNTEN